MTVGSDFNKFCDNIRIKNQSTISSRYKSITKRLNIDYYGIDSETRNSIYVGSYGRGTAINGFSDLDMLFVLPYDVYRTYNSYSFNGQSALLQAIKKSIKKTYSGTSIGADGQVVLVPFTDGVIFEVVPCFVHTDDSYTYPDSNGGGAWKKTNPKPEIDHMDIWNSIWNGNLKWLCRMTRAWKHKWNVPIGGLLIDTLAYNFLRNWEYREKTSVYYDWMCRDFFQYMGNQDENQSYWYAIGSSQLVYRKGKFEYKARQCYKKSIEAVDAYSNGYNYTARELWREIYGTVFPR